MYDIGYRLNGKAVIMATPHFYPPSAAVTNSAQKA
jgi:hypothetical protein